MRSTGTGQCSMYAIASGLASSQVEPWETRPRSVMYIIKISDKIVGYTVVSRYGTMFPSQGPPAAGHRHHPTHTPPPRPGNPDMSPTRAQNIRRCLVLHSLQPLVLVPAFCPFLLPLLPLPWLCATTSRRPPDRIAASAFIHPAQPLSLDLSYNECMIVCVRVPEQGLLVIIT